MNMIIKPNWFEKMKMKPGSKGLWFKPSGWQGFVYLFSVVIITFLLLISSIVIGVAGFILAVFWAVFILIDIIAMIFKRRK